MRRTIPQVARAIVSAALICSGGASLHGEFAFDESEKKLALREGDAPVLVFNYGTIEPPSEGTPRGGYIHPLYGPDGDELTDDFPDDHLHHRGVFFGWPAMTVLGRPIDVWHLKGMQPHFEKWGPRKAGDRSAAFAVRNGWRLDGEDEPAIREFLRYTVHAADSTGRAIDVHATFTNLTDEPIILSGSPQSAYGGLNIRIDGERPDVKITTAEGAVEENVNAIDPPSPWADHSSRAAEERPHSGVAIFQHPGNPDYPARNWTLRPYGFLGAAWPGEQNYSLERGKSLDLRYRLFVHRGTAEEANVGKRFKEYAKRNRKNL